MHTFNLRRVLLLVVAKDGNGAAIPIAYAWVPAESASHVCCVIQMLIKSGIKVESVPIFTDQGNLLAAAVALQQSVLGVTLSHIAEYYQPLQKALRVLLVKV
jgi:hypothetical protein